MKVDLIYAGCLNFSKAEEIIVKVYGENLKCNYADSDDKLLQLIADSDSDVVITIGDKNGRELNVPDCFCSALNSNYDKMRQTALLKLPTYKEILCQGEVIGFYKIINSRIYILINNINEENTDFLEALYNGLLMALKEKEQQSESFSHLNEELENVLHLSDGNNNVREERTVPKHSLYSSTGNSKRISFEKSKDVNVVTRKGTFTKKAIAVFALLLVISFSYVLALYYLVQPMKYDSVAAFCQNLYGSQTKESAPAGYLIRFTSLFKANKEVGGWIIVPATDISCPVVYSTDDFYDNHLFDGSQNRFGTLHFSKNQKRDEFNYNTVIYGNNSGEKRGFSNLTKYLERQFFEQAATIEMNTVSDLNNWKAFSVIEYDSSKFDPSLNEFFDEEEFSRFLNCLQQYSAFNTSMDVKGNDRILTLITNHKSENGDSLAVVFRQVRNKEKDDRYNNVIAEVNKDVKTAEEFKAENFQVIANVEPTIISTTFAQPESEATTVISTNSTTTKNITTAATVATTKEKAAEKTTKKPTEATKPKATKPPENNGKVISVYNSNLGKRVTDDAVAIVAQIVQAEMGSSFSVEALKAQAVASYTYLLYYGAGNGKYPSVAMRDAPNKVLNAVKAVQGETITYNGKLCNAKYSATSAGKTANCEDVWNDDLPYLRSVDSSVEKSLSGFNTTRTYKASDIAKWVKDEYNIDLNKVKDKNKWLTCTYDSNELYVKSLSLGGLKSVRGFDFRVNLVTKSRAGSSKLLRSHAFNIKYISSDDCFVFDVFGYGHGVGLSQNGANIYAKNGWSYKQILEHYYPGAKLS